MSFVIFSLSLVISTPDHAKLYLFIFLIIAIHGSAQSYVSDKELYLNGTEIARVASLLIEFHQRTGNIVLLSTDSSDTGAPSLQAGRREEGVTLMLKNAMETLQKSY